MTADDRVTVNITSRTKFFIGVLAVLLLGAVIGGTVWIFRLTDQERQRELRSWQIRMGIVAASRAADIERWVNDILDVPKSLAANESVRLYMTLATEEGNNESGAQDTGPDAEVTYLRNLIEVTALRAGFGIPMSAGQLGANVQLENANGIALTDSEGRFVVATRGMPALSEKITEAIAKARKGEFVLIDMHRGGNGEPVVGFAGPVFGIQQDESAGPPLGYVVGVKQVGGDLWSRLPQPGESTRTGVNMLLRGLGQDNTTRGRVEFLSPLADGSGPLELEMDANDPKLASAFAILYPGEFAERVDHNSVPVLVTSRAVTGTSWVVARSVAISEALGPTEERLANFRLILVLMVVGVAVAMIAIWRNGTSVRYAQVAQDLNRVTSALSEQTEFLTTVTDAQPTFICVMDRDGKISFANRYFDLARETGKDELIGKTLESVIGRAAALDFERLNRQVRITGETASEVLVFDRNDGRRYLKATHIPLDRDEKGQARDILMITEDVSEIILAQEKQRRMLRDLVHVLVGLVDQRDPFSANHSARVAEVAVAVAKELEQPADVEMTVDIAGNLMNLGKIFVPQEVLTKSETLSDEEAEMIRGSILRSADMLETVRFDLPVVEVIRQLQERWDGLGYPLGLKQKNISTGARIVSVANAFVAMVSPRAFRDAMDFHGAIKLLMNDAEVKFDMAVVAALANVLENRGGLEKWAHFRRSVDITD